jgi:hypothetical protein
MQINEDSGFYQIGGGKIINLDLVSNIAFLEHKQRIIFNMSHSIEIKNDDTNETSTIADYKYWELPSIEEYNAAAVSLTNKISSIGFLISSSTNKAINPLHISYVNVDHSKNRIVFNLNTSITSRLNGLLTNDYVFWNANSDTELSQMVDDLHQQIL